MFELNGNGCDEIIEYNFLPIDEVGNSLSTIKISERFAESLNKCFCKMSLHGIEVFLEIVSFEENDKIWTWNKLRNLKKEILSQEGHRLCGMCFKNKYCDEIDEIAVHHPWPRSRFARNKAKHLVEVSISKRWENAYHHCFCNMSIPEILCFLEEIFNSDYDRIWTWSELKKLRGTVITRLKDVEYAHNGKVILPQKEELELININLKPSIATA